MFEFGKDLRRIFCQTRDGADRAWLELISADLLQIEARQQAVDAGRVSCRRPGRAWLTASMLWREHARRTGARLSATRALSAAQSAARAACARPSDPTLAMEADLEMALTLLLDHDLRGGTADLDSAAAILAQQTTPTQPELSARIVAAHALVRARQARLTESDAEHAAVAALLDAALHAVTPHSRLAVEAAEVRLERATLMLEGGILKRDARRLDLAGRDLRALVADCAVDERPITRARALTLCAAGLSSLAALAGDDRARAQALVLFDAASEAFTPDHSPLDWIGVVLARAAWGAPAAEALRLAQRLTAGEGLILGALVRRRRLAAETASAAAIGDGVALEALLAEARARLAAGQAHRCPLDWVVEQITLAETGAALGRLTRRTTPGNPALALCAAAEIAREHGCALLAEEAESLTGALNPAR